MICLSKQFNQAGFRQKEVRLALDTAMQQPEGEIFIIPARLEECDVLESLKKWQWVDLFEGDGYKRLMQALRKKTERSISPVKHRGSKAQMPKTKEVAPSITLPSYASEKFINRAKEIEAVVSMLKNPKSTVRSIVFLGERGSGKLWLSLHLHRTILRDLKGVTSWLFSLEPPAEGYMPWGQKARVNEYFVKRDKRFEIDKFLLNIAKNLFGELPRAHTILEIVADIRHYVLKHSDEQFVLILDSAYEGDWSLLEQLEAYFLGDLLSLKNFFVIITGRGRPYPWKIPHLITATRFDLGRFSIIEIQEQIEKLGLSLPLSAKSIYDIGGGWPLFTSLIAYSRDEANILEIAADILFGIISVQERSKIRRYFEALCPLDGFGETEAALMVGAYDPMSEREDGRFICRKMNETRLVGWKNGRYIIDEAVQEVLRKYLLLFKRDTWIRLNAAAHRHFETEANDPTMSRFRFFFEEQMKKHAQVLTEAATNSS